MLVTNDDNLTTNIERKDDDHIKITLLIIISETDSMQNHTIGFTTIVNFKFHLWDIYFTDILIHDPQHLLPWESKSAISATDTSLIYGNFIFLEIDHKVMHENVKVLSLSSTIEISFIEINIKIPSSFFLEAHHPSADDCYNKSLSLAILQYQV